jgi:diguanylate cyclase (GGDEF)-like protein
MPAIRSSYAEMREILRWRVAIVLVALMSTLMVTLGIVNTRMGLADTALLAWIVFGLNALSFAALLVLPRRVGSTLFFGTILALTVFAVVFGWWNDRPLYYWGYLFPPVVVFLLRPWSALAAMLAYGAFVIGVTATQVVVIEVVRFASVYGLMICFVTTYALLEERASRQLRELGDRDGLTGCFNRRSFNEALARLATPRGEAVALGVLLADVDHFKAINDQRGHLEGDRVLVAVADTLARGLQAESVAGRATLYRYGGEEFAVIARGRSAAELGLLAEALRSAIAAGGSGLAPGEVTISIGAAGWWQGSEAPEAALQRADEVLYEAKRAGRNRVVVSGAASRITGQAPVRHGSWN